jgi:hypothetical protein
MNKNCVAGFIILMSITMVAFTGCMESKNTRFNTDTPVKVAAGTLSNDLKNSLYIELYDFNNRQTTADGIAEITMFKGRFEDNDPDQVNQIVYSKTYNLKASEFEETEFIHKREIKRTELLWKTDLPDEFKPKLGDVFKINIYFQPSGINQRLANTTYIVWG